MKSCHNLLLLKGQATGPAGLGVEHRAGRRGEEGSPEVQGSQEAMRHTHADTEVDSIVAVHLLGRPAQGRVQSRIHDELVVPPLEARGFLPISPTFLVHPRSFTLSGKEGYAMGVQASGLTPLPSPSMATPDSRFPPSVQFPHLGMTHGSLRSGPEDPGSL